MELFDHGYNISNQLSERLSIAQRRIEFVRKYTLILLEDVSEDQWFWQPDGLATHIAWQVGHIAVSAYGLALFRQRGRAEVDGDLMTGKFRKCFMRGTEVNKTRDDFPTPIEIKEVLDRVHHQIRKEIASFDGASLDEPVEPPHAAFASRYGALLFAGDHEMLHAGQIGLIRRLMGKAPIR